MIQTWEFMKNVNSWFSSLLSESKTMQVSLSNHAAFIQLIRILSPGQFGLSLSFWSTRETPSPFQNGRKLASRLLSAEALWAEWVWREGQMERIYHTLALWHFHSFWVWNEINHEVQASEWMCVCVCVFFKKSWGFRSSPWSVCYWVSPSQGSCSCHKF